MLFELLRVAIGKQGCLSHTPTAGEWRELYVMAEKQALLGICFHGVERLHEQKQTPPQDLLFEWIGAAEYIKQKNALQNKRCVELQKMLKEAGIRSSILKGQGIASRYGELVSLRQPGDIDIYVDCGLKGALQFAKSVGCEGLEWDYKHLHLDVFQDTEVEMHYRVEVLLNQWKNRELQKWFREHEDAVLASGFMVDDYPVTTPTVEFNLFYILLHIYRHFLYEGVGMRQLMDYYFVLKNLNPVPIPADAPTRRLSPRGEGSKQAEITRLLKQFGMYKFARGIMWVMRRVFGLEKECLICEPLESEGRFILSEVMEGGSFGHYDERLSSDRGGKLQTMKKIVKHNIHLIHHYPAEIIWPPIWFVWHKCWKTGMRLKVKSLERSRD